MTTHSKLVPIIVALPLFLQNIDLTATTVALPAMAQALGSSPLHLNLVIAVYAISLAVFLPLSAWLADRFGPKRIFCFAIILFASASASCAIAQSSTFLIASRVFQGFGAAMMVPVGRLILLRSVPPSELMRAMVWFTIPSAVGRLTGPLIGGSIVTLGSWRWIFFVNIPLGAIALLLAATKIDADPLAAKPPRFDFCGFALLGVGLGATLGGLEALGRDLGGAGGNAALILVVGVALLALYAVTGLKRADPVIDLSILRYRTFRTNVVGAAPLRLANFAVPFLLPLMLQLGFGWSALDAGMVASGSALGALGTRLFMRRAMTRMSFRSLFLLATLGTSLIFALYGLLSPQTPVGLVLGLVFLGGLSSSLCMVALNTLGYVDIPVERRSHATALATMTQQAMSATGVVLAAGILGIVTYWRSGNGAAVAAADFTPTFFAVALLAAVSLWPFSRIGPDEGRELRDPS